MKYASSARGACPDWPPAIMLPAQLGVRSLGPSPEMHLVAAILEDAVCCLTRNAGARRGRRHRELVEARAWFQDERRDWPFAFVNVCELLGLDATAVRQRLRPMLRDLVRPATEPAEPAVRGPASLDVCLVNR
jgi:hypothetical protein